MKEIQIYEGEKFYPAYGPYRSFGSKPELIFATCNSYVEAVEALENCGAISEDGKSIFVRRGTDWVDVYFDGKIYREKLRFKGV